MFLPRQQNLASGLASRLNLMAAWALVAPCVWLHFNGGLDGGVARRAGVH